MVTINFANPDNFKFDLIIKGDSEQTYEIRSKVPENANLFVFQLFFALQTNSEFVFNQEGEQGSWKITVSADNIILEKGDKKDTYQISRNDFVKKLSEFMKENKEALAVYGYDSKVGILSEESLQDYVRSQEFRIKELLNNLEVVEELVGL